MDAPERSTTGKIISVIIENGPITASGIVERVDWPGSYSSLSGMISQMWNRLGNDKQWKAGFFKRDKNSEGSYVYQLANGITPPTVKDAVNVYRSLAADEKIFRSRHKPKQKPKQERKVAPKQEPKVVNTPEVANTPEVEDVLVEESMLAEIVKSVVAEMGKTVRIKIEVSGKVEFIHKFGGN